MSIQELNSAVSSQEAFSKNVKVNRGTMGAAGALLAISILLLVRNIFSAWRSMDRNPGATFWDLFFSTTGENYETSPILVALVWGPVIVLPLAAAFFIYSMITNRGHSAKLYDDFRQRGYVAPLDPIGFQLKIGNDNHAVSLIGDPNATDEANAQTLHAVRAQIAAPTFEKKPFTKALTKAKILGTPASLSEFFPGAPQGASLVASLAGNGAVVIRNADPTKRPRAYAIK